MLNTDVLRKQDSDALAAALDRGSIQLAPAAAACLRLTGSVWVLHNTCGHKGRSSSKGIKACEGVPGLPDSLASVFDLVVSCDRATTTEAMDHATVDYLLDMAPDGMETACSTTSSHMPSFHAQRTALQRSGQQAEQASATWALQRHMALAAETPAPALSHEAADLVQQYYLIMRRSAQRSQEEVSGRMLVRLPTCMPCMQA